MKALFLADLHVGSRVSVSIPDVGGSFGRDTYAPIRKRLFSKWEEASKGEWGNPDILIVDADLIEGQNIKEHGHGLTTTDIDEQCDEACELIDMWKAKKLFILRGSDYHVNVGSTGLSSEEHIARKLGAEKYPHSKDSSGYHYYITIDQITFHVAHHVECSRVFHYKSTPVAKEMLFAKLNDQLRHEMGKYKTNVVIRAHAHSFIAVEYAVSLGMVLPCWKALDSHMLKRGSIAMSPDIGYVGFDVRGDSYRWEKHLYKLPEFQLPPHVIIKSDGR
jgi:hypothetical protein